MMRGTYGTVEDEDEDDVERQRHLSSERNFVPRDAFSSSQRRGSNTSGNRNTIATRVAMLSVAAVASLAVVQKTSERTLLVNDDGASAASASSSSLGPRRRTSNSGEILGFTPSKTLHGLQQRGGGKDEEDEYDDEKPSSSSLLNNNNNKKEEEEDDRSSWFLEKMMPRFDWKKHHSHKSAFPLDEDEEEEENERMRSGDGASSSSSSSSVLPRLGGSNDDKKKKKKKSNPPAEKGETASLGGNKSNKLEDDIGFDSLLKNPPKKKKVEKPKPKVVEKKPTKEEKKEKKKKNNNDDDKDSSESPSKKKEEEETQTSSVSEKPKPYDSTDMLSKVPSSTTLSAADILAREGQDASSLLVDDAPNDTEDALSQDIGLSLDDGAATPSSGTLAAAETATTAQQPTPTMFVPQQQEQPTTTTIASSSTTFPTPQAPIITSSSFSNGVVPPRPPMVVDSSSTATTTEETSTASSGPDLSSMDALPDEDVNLDVDDPSGRISSSSQEEEEEEEEDRARGHVDDEEDIVVPDDDGDTTENEQAETGESEEDPAPAEQQTVEQSQREVAADADEQQQQQQQIEVQQQQLQQQQIQQQQQQQQQQEQQYYQPQQQQPINFQPKIIIPKQKSSRRRSSGSSQQALGVSQEDLEEKLEEASASAVGNVVDAFVGKLDNAANAARAGPKAIERSLSPMDRLTESIARILNDKEEENNKERRSSRRRYDDEDEDDYEYDERDRRRRRDDRRRDEYDEERDYRRSDNARQSLGEPMSTEDKLNQKMRDLGVEDAIAEKQRREDDARMGEMIKQKLSLMDPDIVEDKPYLEPTQLEMNQIVERTLKKLGIEDIAKREKDTKMEEKLEQIIAEKFDKMGLNNDDDDDEEDNLAPFRKGKKASRIEKRVQKAVAGIENKLYANTFGQLNGNQQMQPQMGVPMMQQPYGYQPQPVLYDQFGRPVVTAPQPVVQQQPQEIAGHTEKDRAEDAIERMEALFESKMKEKDQPSRSASSAYARASSARGDDDMPENLDDLSLNDDADILSTRRDTGGADQEPDLEALRKEVAQVVAQSIEEKKAAAQKQVLTAEQQLKEKLDSWKTNEATKDMDADFQAMQQMETQPSASTSSLTTDVQSAAEKVKAMLLGGNGADLTSSSVSAVPEAAATDVDPVAAAAIPQQQQPAPQQVPQPVATFIDPATGQPVMTTQPADIAVPSTATAAVVAPTTEEPVVEAAVPTGEVVEEKPAKKEKKPKKLSDMDIIMGGLSNDDDDDDGNNSSKKSKKSSKKAKKDPWGDDIKPSKAEKEDEEDDSSATAVAAKDDSVLDNIGGEDDVDSILADYEAAK